MNDQLLRELIEAHGAALTLYARQWCRAPEDAVQDAFLDLLRQNRAPDNPAAWLFKTVRCRAMNQARGDRRRAEHHRRAAAEREDWFLDSEDGQLESKELSRMLRRLPAPEREIVVARAWGGLSFEAIAELVDISASAAHRRYHRALRELGKMLDAKGHKVRTES